MDEINPDTIYDIGHHTLDYFVFLAMGNLEGEGLPPDYSDGEYIVELLDFIRKIRHDRRGDFTWHIMIDFSTISRYRLCINPYGDHPCVFADSSLPRLVCYAIITIAAARACETLFYLGMKG